MSNKCKSCGAEIKWGINRNTGKRIPLDAKPERRFLFGTIAAEQVYLVDTYQTHFATCPNADEHRKK